MRENVNKVVTNTGILYGKMLLTMGISLYTTRIVLNALGATDFGIYNLVAGVVAMLSFLNTAMSVSTQRYMSYYQGVKMIDKQKSVFYNSFVLHFFLGLFIVAIIELVGVFLFNGFFNIPIDRIDSAKVIYHFMALSVFFSIISVPFLSSVNAHEDMYWVAIVDVIEVVMKLSVALLLAFQILAFDNLKFYGLSTAMIGLLSLLCYSLFCFSKYDECTFQKENKISKPLLKELTSFAGWNLFGSLCGLGRVQGIAVLFNLFFGTVVNAAYGIANQVSAQVSFFSATMLRALNPQIMKSEGAGDRQKMLQLSMIASKFGFFLLAIIAIPCIVEMSTILTFWLKDVPDYTIIFCRLILVGAMVGQLTIGLQSAVQATGRIKVYQSVVGGILLLNLPIAYCLLKLEYPVYYVLISYILIEALACVIRIFVAKRFAGLEVISYLKKVISKIFLPMIFTILACFLVVLSYDGVYRVLITITLSFFVSCLSVYFLGLEFKEREYISAFLTKIYKSILCQK